MSFDPLHGGTYWFYQSTVSCPRVSGHGCFDWLFVYLILIPVSCFVVLFSVFFRFQLSVLDPTALKLFEYSSLVFLCLSAPSHKIGFKTEKPSVLKPILCEGALRHRNTRELYSNNLESGWAYPKQNRKQDNKTRHRDQNKVNK